MNTPKGANAGGDCYVDLGDFLELAYNGLNSPVLPRRAVICRSVHSLGESLDKVVGFVTVGIGTKQCSDPDIKYLGSSIYTDPASMQLVHKTFRDWYGNTLDVCFRELIIACFQFMERHYEACLQEI